MSISRVTLFWIPQFWCLPRDKITILDFHLLNYLIYIKPRNVGCKFVVHIACSTVIPTVDGVKKNKKTEYVVNNMWCHCYSNCSSPPPKKNLSCIFLNLLPTLINLNTPPPPPSLHKQMNTITKYCPSVTNNLRSTK